jgi:hypothetical protein
MYEHGRRLYSAESATGKRAGHGNSARCKWVRDTGTQKSAGAVGVCAAAALALGSCANILLTPVAMGNAPVTPACQALITRVFAASGFEPVSMPDAPPMLFGPRMTAPLTYTMTLGWAIGVSFVGEHAGCRGFQLQALSPEPDCMPEPCLEPLTQALGMSLQPQPRTCYNLFPTCPLSPTGSPELTAAIAELRRRIDAALVATPIKE